MAVSLLRVTIAAPVKPHDEIVTFVAASAAYLKAGDLAYIDREAMELLMPVDPAVRHIWRVLRGVAGTPATSHAVNNQIYVGSPGQFYNSNPSGSATQDTTEVIPWINILTGDMFQLSSGGSWQQIGEGGIPQVANSASGSVAEYSAAGPITVANGIVTINSATGRAMTLPAPIQGDDGTVMTIIGAGGGAHTVTVAAGFNGAGGTYDIATFATTGGTLVVQVMNGVWRVLSAVGVTIA